MDIFLLLAIGSIVGVLSSFFGIGGGSLIVPLLYSLYPHLPSQSVIAISLGTIFLITTFNSYRYYKLDLTPAPRIIFLFAFSCIIGALIGNEAAYLIDKEMSKKIIASILVLTIIKLNINFKTKTNFSSKKQPLKLLTTGLLGAFISSLTGLGGGIVFTPMLMAFVKLPQKEIAPQSNIAMSIATLVGVIPHLFIQGKVDSSQFSNFIAHGFVGNVNFSFIFLLFVSAFFTASYGIKLNNTVPEAKKKILLSLLLIILSIKLVVK